jgi:hypothetical protein
VVERLFAFIPGDGLWLDAISRQLSPYDLNPLNINPFKRLIKRFVDFEAIRRNQGLELFISATNVHSGELRVFRRAEITAEVEYFERLRELGERETRRFLDLHFQHIGCRSTMDMAAKRQPVPVE